METAPLNSFATWARTALIREVTARIAVVLAPASPERIEHPKAVDTLEKAVNAAGGGEMGRAVVADRVAYTWFNRIIALRFMDANGYTGIGVVSPQGEVVSGQPEILAEAKRGSIDAAVVGTKTREMVTGLLNGTRRSEDPQGEAYAVLLAEYCRHWNRAMPFMFEREGDFTELLIPANLLADDSVINRAVKVLTADACKDVEVIGWLYQFYISERKDEVFAGFKTSKNKAGANEIPAATQLFTPHWIVRYLVENSLGRLWMLNRPSSRLVNQMNYYLAPLGKETDFLNIGSPEELKLIDPACGSGHMLTYAFDLLYAIYAEEGYAPADIPGLILSNNLFGTEIDARAGALAAFALTMKARARQRTFFNNQVEPNVCVIEPVTFREDELRELAIASEPSNEEREFWTQFEAADLFGALIRPRSDLLADFAPRVNLVPDDILSNELVSRAARVVRQATFLTHEYEVVIANPPYMGSANMGPDLSEWIRQSYPLEKQDLYVCFVSRALALSRRRGRIAMIIGDTWMTAKTSEKFRKEIIEGHGFDSFLHLDDVSNHPDVFGANAAFVLSTSADIASSPTTFVALKPLSSEDKVAKLLKAIANHQVDWVHTVGIEQLKAVPGVPLAYWLTDAMREAFARGKRLESFGSPKQGIKTGDNERFLRFWWEVSRGNILVGASGREEAKKSGKRWFPCQKGGEYRRWFGNDQYVVNWFNDGDEIRNFRDARGKLRSRPQNLDWMFRAGVTWGTISSGASSFRASPAGTVSESKGAICYASDPRRAQFLLGFLNSSVASVLLAALSPTIDYGEGSVAKLPVDACLIDGPTADLASRALEISKDDWERQETAFGFAANELVRFFVPPSERLAGVISRRKDAARAATRTLADIEESINRTVADKTGLTDEVVLRPQNAVVSLIQNVEFLFGRNRTEAEYTRQSNLRLGQELVSYAVGCMFGRYSLDEPGLILADQGATLSDYLAKIPNPIFMPDSDNVLPIIDGDWFEDDIVVCFRKFLRTAFGEQHFEENLRFVTESLGVKDIRDYFVKSFFEDHWRRYRKRPVYWLFSSPEGTFNALIYMHRYTPSTVSTVLNEYLREFRAKLTSSLQQQERLAASGGAPRQQAAAQREADRLRKVLPELDEYEHHVLYPLASKQVSIDLDDGVKVNYARFGAALKKIPGLEASDE